MGSVSASGVPVVSKDSYSYRKRDILITRENSATDGVSNLVTAAPVRTIGSGSIVRKDYSSASADMYETLVWGVQFGARSSSTRVGREGERSLSVPNSGVFVVPTTLQSNTPQISVTNCGSKVVRRQGVGDGLVDRV